MGLGGVPGNSKEGGLVGRVTGRVGSGRRVDVPGIGRSVKGGRGDSGAGVETCPATAAVGGGRVGGT